MGDRGMFAWIQYENVEVLGRDAMLERLGEYKDLSDDSQPVFLTGDFRADPAYWPENAVLILPWDPVVPVAAKKVTEWELPA